MIAGGLAAALGEYAALLSAALAATIAAVVLRPRKPDEPVTAAPSAPPAIGIHELIEGVGDPLLLTEARRITHANAAALALLGEHILGEDVLLAIRVPAAAARLTGDAISGEPLVFAGLGGPERRWELDARPIHGDRRIVRLTDRTAAYAAERMRVDFVANASHELRTPLATLLGFIETLEDSAAADDAAIRARFLGIMTGEARRMQRLIDDLMSLSRIEADRHVAPRETIALEPLIGEVRLAAFTGAASETSRIELAVEPDLPEVVGDRAQLSQLLHNLVGNAVKYGGASAPIMVSARRDAAAVRVTVIDRGDGIAPEHLPRLTERFYRVDPGRSRTLGGTGLGLAIVKHIVERHRGRLDIASRLGEGTTVTVWLPVGVTKASRNGHGDGAVGK